MNVKRIAVVASVLCIVGGTVGGCTNASSNGNSATNTDTYTATNTGSQSQDRNQNVKLRSVGVTVGDLSNPFFVVMGKGAEAEAKKIGGDNVKVAIVSSGYDLNQQTNQIENFVAADTDLIILNASDSKGIRPAIDKARQAGKIVIAVDTGVDAEVDATVTTNNLQAGEVACKYIVDRLKAKGML